ncbi:MAG: TerB family tellurite resistance protein [Planctomycetota bacterium]|nr:TerB family tellurite resistance protein [Planctomycetota bacterium]
MSEVEISIVFITVAAAIVVFPCLVKNFKLPLRPKKRPQNNIILFQKPNPNILNCRAQLKKEEKDNCLCEFFEVEICGTIHAPDDMCHTTIQISVADITDDAQKSQPVYNNSKQPKMQNSDVFCHNADLGKLPNKDTTLPDWMSVAKLQCDWMLFAYKGKRNLQFTISILSGQDGQELCDARCSLSYENPAFGYIDLQENIQRTKTLAVAIAFAVSAADNKLYNCEIELIKNWARNNIDVSQASNNAKDQLEKALKKIAQFFQSGYKVDTDEICREVVEITPVAQRYEILELCLHVAQAKGVAAKEEISMLKNLANRLEVDDNKFRTMMEKILPVTIHQVKDMEVILGVRADMGKEETCQHLNKEYRKWHARVTNSDPQVQAQADQMLQFIAEARNTCVESAKQ